MFHWCCVLSSFRQSAKGKIEKKAKHQTQLHEQQMNDEKEEKQMRYKYEEASKPQSLKANHIQLKCN